MKFRFSPIFVLLISIPLSQCNSVRTVPGEQNSQGVDLVNSRDGYQSEKFNNWDTSVTQWWDASASGMDKKDAKDGKAAGADVKRTSFQSAVEKTRRDAANDTSTDWLGKRYQTDAVATKEKSLFRWPWASKNARTGDSAFRKEFTGVNTSREATVIARESGDGAREAGVQNEPAVYDLNEPPVKTFANFRGTEAMKNDSPKIVEDRGAPRSQGDWKNLDIRGLLNKK